MNAEILKKAGIDYTDGVRRFKGRSVLYEKVLAKFPKDTSFARSCSAYAAGNIAELLSTSHELKGVCGNMSLTSLYESAERLVTLLRSGIYTSSELDAAFSDYKRAYFLTRQAVLDAMEE